jgi:RNA 2',3'-cyclic 3'-phosphodiesterase
VKRLFIAVDLDRETRATIDRLSQTLRAESPRASWVAADRLHLTLEFLGSVDPDTELRVRVALEPPIPIPPFRLSFKGLGFFPGSGAPRVLWLGVAEGLQSMRRLHTIVSERVGTSADTHSTFTPHLTLARFRERLKRPRAKTLLELDLTAGPCSIDRVTLYESRVSGKGSVYVPLTEALLTPES